MKFLLPKVNGKEDREITRFLGQILCPFSTKIFPPSLCAFRILAAFP